MGRDEVLKTWNEGWELWRIKFLDNQENPDDKE